MGSRNKLVKFDYLKNNDKALEMGKELFETVKGKWHSEFFKNDNPIVLEIGCGRGEYTVGLAEKFPDKNFIGIDIKGSRIYHGLKYATDNNMDNVGFLRTQVLMMERFFEKGEVDEIWLTFPDPRPLDGDERRRLFSPRFLKLYQQFLKDGGILNLKTDNFGLYDYSLELSKQLGLKINASTSDLYESEFKEMCYGIQTTYERRYLAEGIKINYLQVEL